MADFSISTCCYTKMIMHALKYPHCAVNGVLLASKQKGSSSYHIVDAVPLFHVSLTLTPMLEVALAQVDSLCHASSTGSHLHIVGYYQANEHLKDTNINPLALKIAEKVQSNFSETLLLVIDNKLIGADCERPVFEAYHYHEKKWEPKDKQKLTFDDEERTLGISSACIQTKLYRDLVDFDNHLDNPALDYMNRKLNARIESML